MKKATRKDKERVVEILTRSFANDPHVNWLIESDKVGKEKRLEALMTLAFEETFLHDGVYLSDDEIGTALWKNRKPSGFSFVFLKSRLRFAFAFGAEKTKRAIAMEKLIKQYFPKGDYLYLWFIGVLPEGQGKGVASELLDPVLKDCQEKNLPVFLETANPTNVKIYQRKGFEVYHEWQPEDGSDLTVRFMRKLT